MRKGFLHIAKHSAIYSLGTAALKFGGIILIPLYTKQFSLDEYGLLALFLVIIQFGSQVLPLGQGDSIIRYSNDSNYKSDSKAIYFTIVVLMVSFLLLLGISIYVIAFLLRGEVDFFAHNLNYFTITIAIVIFTVINSLFNNKLRADDKSVLYAVINVIKLIVIIIFAFYFLLYLKTGIEGVLYAILISEIAAFSILVYPMLKAMEFRIIKDIIPKTIKYGVPLSFAIISGSILTTSDRFILTKIAGDAELGLYDLGYRISSLINMIVVMPLTLTLYPIIFRQYQKEGDKEYYRKIHKIAALILFWVGLGIALVGKEIVQILAKNESFFPSSDVVPILVLAMIFVGLNWVVSIGMNLTGNTKSIAINSFICAVLNILLNFALIPYWGRYAASINTVLCVALLYLLYTRNSNKFYKIDYEHNIILKAIVLFVFIYWLGTFVNYSNLIVNVFLKFLLFLLFPLGILLLKGINKNERESLIWLFKEIKS